jgi:hypothetical protein
MTRWRTFLITLVGFCAGLVFGGLVAIVAASL